MGAIEMISAPILSQAKSGRSSSETAAEGIVRGGNETKGVGVGIRDAEARWKDASKAKKKKGRGACALHIDVDLPKK
jgi:hypothetical protein